MDATGKHTPERIDMFDATPFKFINVNFYTSKSKQKFLFVLEAKEGYLSTPPMLYSCMNISLFESLTKVVPS
jgi:hypothetical protein